MTATLKAYQSSTSSIRDTVSDFPMTLSGQTTTPILLDEEAGVSEVKKLVRDQPLVSGIDINLLCLKGAQHFRVSHTQ